MKRTLAIAMVLLALPASVASSAAPSADTPSPPAAVAEVPVYLAVDLGAHQILAEREAERVFLPASMTKVMTAYVAFELIARGELDPKQTFVVAPQTAAKWSGRGTSLALQAGERISADMLLRGVTTASANDASVVLAESVAGSVADWLALMNAEARKLGMTDSRFGTPNGWPDGGATRVSARDMVKLGTALIERHPELYRRYFGNKSMTWNGVVRTNHDPAIGKVPGADGIKTGHTNESGYSFLGTAERDGRRIMIVIGGAQSSAERAAASRELLEWGFSAWEAKRFFASGATVAQARVQNGDARQVGLVAPQGVRLAVPHGARGEPKLAVRYRGPLVAPIAKGSEVAQLELAMPGQPVARVSLVAAQGVEKAGPLDRLVNGLAGLLP